MRAFIPGGENMAQEEFLDIPMPDIIEQI